MLWTVAIYAMLATFNGNTYILDTHQTLADCGHAIVEASNLDHYASMALPKNVELTCLPDPDHKLKAS
jgi:hypothetical protein